MIGKLNNVVQGHVPHDLSIKIVLGFCNDDGDWNFQLLSSFLHINVLNAIRIVPPLSEQKEASKLYKLGNSYGTFSICYAYDSISNCQIFCS